MGMVALPAGIMASGFSQAVHRRQARFTSSVDAALDDGIIDSTEQDLLKGQAASINLSEETMNKVILDRVSDQSSRDLCCPYCHRTLSDINQQEE